MKRTGPGSPGVLSPSHRRCTHSSPPPMTARAKGADKRRMGFRLFPFVRPFARAVIVVQWYDQRLNSLATPGRVRIPLRASGIRDTVWVLSPPNLRLHNRTNAQAPDCQPSLPSRSRSAQNGQKAEANSPFVRASCSSCHVLPGLGRTGSLSHSQSRWPCKSLRGPSPGPAT